MKRLLLSLFAVLVCSFYFSQTPFKRIYPSIYRFIDSNLKHTPDNGYFFLNREAYGSATHLMKTDSFTQGLYFIRITDMDNRVVVKKVIIQ